MNKLFRLCLLPVLLCLCTLTSCESINLVNVDDEDEGKGSTGVQAIIPTSFGMGTQEAPYTVSQLTESADELQGDTVWLIGYAVGETYRSLANACFTPPFEYTSNVLLSSYARCTDVGRCVPVELSSTAQKTTLALSNHPEHHQHAVMLQGVLMKFYGVVGVRKLKQYYWLPDDYAIPTTEPEEWDETEWE